MGKGNWREQKKRKMSENKEAALKGEERAVSPHVLCERRCNEGFTRKVYEDGGEDDPKQR